MIGIIFLFGVIVGFVLHMVIHKNVVKSGSGLGGGDKNEGRDDVNKEK